MRSERAGEVGVYERLARYPLLDALRGRRSRRFGMGMRIPDGPFAYESRHEPLPLTETEEAALAFAACGVTGYALADLSYGRGQGGGMLAGLLGRTVASPDAINTVSVFVANDEATYLLRRPQDFAPAEIPTLVDLARRGELVDLYRRSRIETSQGRAAPPVEPTYNFNLNRWALYAPGGTYLLPVQETTAIYLLAAAMLMVGVALFVAPLGSGALWPWGLTPLTGRAVGAWLIGLGVAAAHMAWEGDWRRVRPASTMFAVFGALELVVLLRFMGGIDWGGARAWIYLLFLMSMLAVGLYGLYAARTSE